MNTHYALRITHYASRFTLHVSRFIPRRILPNVLALFIIFLLSGVLIWISGENPVEVYLILWGSVFGSVDDFGYVLFNATPLIFTGLAVMIGFKCGLFNIGCEGQLYIAGFTAAYVGIHLNWTSSWLLIPVCTISAMLAGGLWAAIPGVLKAKYGVHEVINTIMMNFIAIALTNYLVTQAYKEPDQMIPQTSPIHEAARLPRLAALAPILPLISRFLLPPSNPLNLSLLLAVGLVWMSHFFFTRTRWGYEIRWVGNATEVATCGGINVRSVIVSTMALSGAIAGLAGVWDVMGYRYRFLDNFSPGFGFTGIAVATLGRNNPYGVLFAAILFGALNKGALDIEILKNVPRELFFIMQATLILCLICAEGFPRKTTSC